MHIVIVSILLKLIRMIRPQYLFGTLLFINVLLFLFPVFLRWDPRNTSLLSADLLFTSIFFQPLVVMGLSLALPNFVISVFRFLCRVTIEKVTRKETCKTASGFSSMFLFIQEATILLYVIPQADYLILNFIMRTRLTLLIWKTFSVIYPQNQNSWPLASWLAIIIFYNTASVTLLCDEYINDTSHNDRGVISGVFFIFSFIIYAVITIKWHVKIRMQTKDAQMTSDQLTSSCYLVALFICWFGSIVINSTSQNQIEWYDWNSYSIVSYAVMYPMFNLIVIMGELLAAEQELLVIQVKGIKYFC